MTATETPTDADELRRRFPAKYSKEILVELRELLEGEAESLGRPVRVLDQFAGTGLIHSLESPAIETVGVEIEPDLAALHPRTRVGDACLLPFESGEFDAWATSCCLTPEQRILTADLRWVPCGDLEAGDRILAFDEFSPGVKVNGQSVRRKWRLGTIMHSRPEAKECVRVHLENGESVACSADHPWLTDRYAYSSVAARWVRADRLLEDGRWVHRQLDTWAPATDYDAGWLAGMFDGEGSLAFGAHGTPKLSMCQVVGPIIDAAEELLRSRGYKVNVTPRTGTPEHRQPMVNLYVAGGFPAVLRALGELRPGRLLRKLEDHRIETRTIQPDKIRVEAVEPIGRREIQSIETSTGTYIGEGYLMHNTYGNRMGDTYDGRDGSDRHTYRIALGHDLAAGSSAGMQWGCLMPGQRVLRGDWRWVPVEDLEVGDPVLGFDEEITAADPQVRRRGRRWRMGKVEALGRADRDCVSVEFDDGTAVSCTTDHPWLARRVDPGGSNRALEWIKAADLRAGTVVPVFLPTWTEDRSYEAGWLAGILDGEGWYAWKGSTRGALGVAQKDGQTLDRIVELLEARGLALTTRPGQGAVSVEITGGLATHLNLLGTVRAERLLDKTRPDGQCMKTHRDRVVARVKPYAIPAPVVLMSTTCRTYLAEGMGSHNSEYRELHRIAWLEAARVVGDGGLGIVNIKNHYRDDELQRVVEWHLRTLLEQGATLVEARPVRTPGFGHGANHAVRVDAEMILVVRAHPSPQLTLL